MYTRYGSYFLSFGVVHSLIIDLNIKNLGLLLLRPRVRCDQRIVNGLFPQNLLCTVGEGVSGWCT